MACHLNLADPPSMQALHDIALAVKTLHVAAFSAHRDRESSNKVLLGY